MFREAEVGIAKAKVITPTTTIIDKILRDCKFFPMGFSANDGQYLKLP
jgi:hypothetical protein